jgi:type IV pilus assembly protein PilC
MATRAATVKQVIYVWEGRDKRGSRMKGELTGSNPALIRAELRRQGIYPLKVRKKPVSIFSARKRPVKPKDIAIFSRQLATMLTAGVPLVQALEIISEGQANPTARELMRDIKTEIEGGTTLADSLEKHPKYFDELYCGLVRAGEAAGVLDDLLEKIATYKEKIESIKGKIKKALFYPSIVITVAFLVTAILLIYVVPTFDSLFRSFGAELPAFTLLVIRASDFMQAYWWLIAAIVGGTIYGLFLAQKRSRKFAHTLDRIVLQIPVVGAILHKATIARFARTLATTFAAGVPLVEALQTVAATTGNAVYTEAVLRVRDDVATGHQLHLAMRQTGLFPHMVMQMTAIGEEAGRLDEMLNKVADFYDEEVDNAVDALSSMLEPLVMVLIGVIVGGIVIAMYLPVFKLGSVI